MFGGAQWLGRGSTRGLCIQTCIPVLFLPSQQTASASLSLYLTRSHEEEMRYFM